MVQRILVLPMRLIPDVLVELRDNAYRLEKTVSKADRFWRPVVTSLTQRLRYGGTIALDFLGTLPMNNSGN